jgi:hypothetical protein
MTRLAGIDAFGEHQEEDALRTLGIDGLKDLDVKALDKLVDKSKFKLSQKDILTVYSSWLTQQSTSWEYPRSPVALDLVKAWCTTLSSRRLDKGLVLGFFHVAKERTLSQYPAMRNLLNLVKVDVESRYPKIRAHKDDKEANELRLHLDKMLRRGGTVSSAPALSNISNMKKSSTIKAKPAAVGTHIDSPSVPPPPLLFSTIQEPKHESHEEITADRQITHANTEELDLEDKVMGDIEMGLAKETWNRIPPNYVCNKCDQKGT